MNSITIAERAVLERERVARQKRRNGELNASNENESTKRIKTSHKKGPDIHDGVIEISDDEDERISTETTSRSPARRQITPGRTLVTRDHEERFWHGESRSVRNQLVDNPDKTFSLDEIVGKVSP
jgi:hypothetical protein